MKKLLLSLIVLISGICHSFGASDISEYDIIVALDGSGQFKSIQEAIMSVRDYNPKGRTRIFIKKGVYKEKIVCPSWKTNISLIGEDCDSTIITWNDHANINKMGTFRTYTLKAEGLGFEAENLTIENNAEQAGQAVALHVESDKAVFRNCHILGFQDTVFTGNENSRQYYENCYIDGTTDFIFGPATAWFENCTLHSKRNSYITAASTPEYKKYGYIFNNCKINADNNVDKVYLGRPWRSHSAVTFMNCEMGDHITAKGWDNWKNPENEKTARYIEYNNSGQGAARTERVGWSRTISDEEAREITIENVFEDTSNWDPNGIVNNPYSAAAPINYNSTVKFRDAIKPFLGKPYVSATLDTAGEEHLVINLNQVDCTTFLEYVSASLLSGSTPDAKSETFKEMVQSLRYRNSVIDGYDSRIHYFSEWIDINNKKGYITEVTCLMECEPLNLNVDFMSTHPDSYRQLKEKPELVESIRETEAHINTFKTSYVPKEKLANEMHKIKEGDLIAIVTDIKGLDISHVGFAYIKDDTVYLLHASSDKKRVLIDPLPLDKYLMGNKRQTGIRVLRLNKKI